MGRKAIINADKIKRIADFIAAGNHQNVAAKAHGVSESTHYAWLKRGEQERQRLETVPGARPKASESVYLEYLEAIERALAEAEASLVLNIRKAAAEPRTWQAAAWMLTHGVARDRWKQVQRTEITGADGGPVQSESKSAYTEAEIIALADEILGIKENQANQENKVDQQGELS